MRTMRLPTNEWSRKIVGFRRQCIASNFHFHYDNSSDWYFSARVFNRLGFFRIRSFFFRFYNIPTVWAHANTYGLMFLWTLSAFSCDSYDFCENICDFYAIEGPFLFRVKIITLLYRVVALCSLLLFFIRVCLIKTIKTTVSVRRYHKFYFLFDKFLLELFTFYRDVIVLYKVNRFFFFGF